LSIVFRGIKATLSHKINAFKEQPQKEKTGQKALLKAFINHNQNSRKTKKNPI
jgi:hypothetical protein